MPPAGPAVLGRIPSHARIFVNTLPATIRDPQFRGKALDRLPGPAQVSPSRIVIEITEKLVIDNYGLFRETMAYFTDLGMSFAVDDVGAGYSGLESIAPLKPTFLKIDISLVRDVHSSLVNREMVKAIVSLGKGIGATVIAEGIHSDEEVQALQAMGVSWGQGYLLARPDSGPDTYGMTTEHEHEHGHGSRARFTGTGTGSFTGAGARSGAGSQSGRGGQERMSRVSIWTILTISERPCW